MTLYQAGPSSAGGPPPLSRLKNARKKARRFLRKHAQAVWAAAFVVLAVGFYMWAAWLTYDFATYVLQPAGDLIWKHAAGHTAAVAFAFAAARYFFRIGLRALPFAVDPASNTVCLAGSLPSVLTWALLTMVIFPVTIAVAFAEHPGLAVAYLATLVGVAATVLGLQTIMKCALTISPRYPALEAILNRPVTDAGPQQAPYADLSMTAGTPETKPCPPSGASVPPPCERHDAS